MKSVSILLLSVLIIVSGATRSFAGGLSTGFSKITIENLVPGTVYNIEEVTSVPLEITNTAHRTVELKIEVIVPVAEELPEGYEPLPDTSWIKIQKTRFEIEPASSGRTDIFLSIPEGKEFEGKKYGVFIWSHTVGETIGLGLKSKLLFTTTLSQK